MSLLTIINDSELRLVEKPAQYLGGERGSIIKQDEAVDFHFCLAFPDTYEVGMSHIGLQILYDLLNRNPQIWTERVYQPLADMEALLRKKGVPLSSLEAKRPLKKFDLVGFSLQYELCMTGILTILDLGGIPILAAERGEDDPIVIAGGPVAYHPEPFADFIDAFLVGDGEELVPEFVDRMRELKAAGRSRKESLLELRKIQGVYVPSLFEAQYDDRGKFLGLKPLLEDYTSVRRRVIATLEGAPYPESPIVPNIRAVHDRLSVEVMRGCVRGCRFCQAGYLYRPQRERSPEEIIRIVGNSLKHTGYEELSLLSLSTADYCSILPLLSAVKERFAKDDQLAISFPSTRVDALKPELLQEVQSVRRSGFTIAPEAGTQRMRDVINKGVTEEELMETARNVFKLGWTGIKMYFMIGLPTETDEDVMAIVDLGRKVKQIAGRGKQVTVSISTHCPKPHTPFQWAEQINHGETVRKQQLLARALREARIGFRYHDAHSSFLEGVFCRGDRQLGKAILRAYELGARLEGWVEELDQDAWSQAFADTGIDPHHYLHERGEDDALPWDHISCDIPKRYFLKEWKRATAARVTPDCLTQSCSICGACDYDAARNVLFDRERTEKRLGIENPPWQPIIDRRNAGQTTDLIESVARDEAAAKLERQGSYELKEYLRTETDTGGTAAPVKPDLETVQRVRLRYGKTGPACYVAHLELADLFFRAARRAGLPIAYSKGFNPKPRLSFGPPIQLGLASRFEFVDVYFTTLVNPQEALQQLNSELAAGIEIFEATELEIRGRSIQALVTAQRFSIELPDDLAESGTKRATLETRLVGIADHTLERARKHKKSTVRLGDYTSEISLGERSLDFTIDYSGPSTLKPTEVVEALCGEDPLSFMVTKVSARFASGANCGEPERPALFSGV